MSFAKVGITVDDQDLRILVTGKPEYSGLLCVVALVGIKRHFFDHITTTKLLVNPINLLGVFSEWA